MSSRVWHFKCSPAAHKGPAEDEAAAPSESEIATGGMPLVMGSELWAGSAGRWAAGGGGGGSSDTDEVSQAGAESECGPGC